MNYNLFDREKHYLGSVFNCYYVLENDIFCFKKDGLNFLLLDSKYIIVIPFDEKENKPKFGWKKL